MTDAEDLLLEIANSMSKDFSDPIDQLNWILDEVQKYFREKAAAHTTSQQAKI